MALPKSSLPKKLVQEKSGRQEDDKDQERRKRGTAGWKGAGRNRLREGDAEEPLVIMEGPEVAGLSPGVVSLGTSTVGASAAASCQIPTATGV